MGFSGQEYWSGLPFPPPGDLLDPGIELMSLRSPALAGGVFTTSATCTPFTQLAGEGLPKGGGLVTHLRDGLGPIRRQKSLIFSFCQVGWGQKFFGGYWGSTGFLSLNRLGRVLKT